MKLFKIDQAIEIRNYYKDILIGMPITKNSIYKIDGIFVCNEGSIQKALDILIANDFDERATLIELSNNDQKFQVYVYMYDGVNVAFDELDTNLTEKGIVKIYDA